MVRWRNTPHVWLLTPLALLFFWLAINSMVGDSPTMDEQNHLGRGLAFVRSGDPRLSLEHPPFTNALSGLLPALLLDLHLPFDHPSWAEQSPPDVYWYVFADQVMWQSGNDVTQMLFLARLPIVFLTLGLGLIGYHFARVLWGGLAAPVVFILLLFDPNVLANGRYVTTDMGGATFIFLATYALWKWSIVNGQWSMVNGRWSRVDHWQLTINHWLFLGISMGLAFGSKLLALLFVPIWGLLALLPLYPGWEGRQWVGAARRFGRFIAAGLLSIVVVWLIFGLEWRAFRFQSDYLLWLNQFSGPMPTFWAGLEQIALLTGGGRYEAFMAGRFSADGFAWYFPFAFAVKTPLLTLFLLVLALIWLWGNGRFRRRAIFLTLPIVAYFLFSSQSALNIGYRHLLPVLPFVYLLIGGLWGSGGRWPAAGGWWREGATAVILLWHIATALWIHPHYLSYFNREVGGPANGYRLLIDSNVDWGQDLLRLRDWMAENGVEQVKLGWFGTADPDYYGLNYTPLPGFPRQPFYGLWTEPPFNPANPEPGLYAISATALWEMPLPEGQKYVYAWFRDREPDDRVGYSILLYEVRESP